jgi:hypothetical protein
MEKGMLITTYGQNFSYIISAIKGVEFVSDRMSNITLNDRWCDIIVPNMHYPNENKDDIKVGFYEEL